MITAADTAQLDLKHHLILDLASGSYQIDTSLGAVDLTYVDLVDAAGRLQPIEHVVNNAIATGTVTRGDLAAGFSVTASGDQVELSGHGGTEQRRIKCFNCICDDESGLCICEEIHANRIVR